MSPTKITYLEKFSRPYNSQRDVEVYGGDKDRRLEQLPREMDAFEKSLTSVVVDVKNGHFEKMKRYF
jgi:hypothetical protein